MAYYGYYRNSGIPRLLNYEAIEQHYANTKPIRQVKNGHNGGKMPLGMRNKIWYEMKKDGDNYECWLHREKVVTYFKNGEIEIRNPAYNSISTSNFLSDLFGKYGGVDSYIFDHALVVGVRGEENYAWQKLQTSESVRIKSIAKDASAWDKGRWEYINPKPMVTHKINRQKLNAIKARLTDLYTYAKHYTKLLGGVQVSYTDRYLAIGDVDLDYFRFDNAGWYISEKMFKEGATLVKGWIDSQEQTEAKIENWNTVLKVIANRTGVREWQTRSITANETQVVKGMDKLLMGLYRDEVMDATETTEPKRDRYGYLYRRCWQAYHDDQV